MFEISYISRLSIRLGIILAIRVLEISRQGLVLTSIKKVLKFSSIMKSSPKSYFYLHTSKELSSFNGSIFLKTDFIAISETFFIWGTISLKKSF